MFKTIELPIWALALLLVFAAVTFASHFLFPSVRWFFRKRAERLVVKLNTRLKRPIQPFKLARRMDTVNRLIHDPQVAQAILEHARSKGIPEEVAFEDAKRYAREIVPGFSASLYFGFATRAARWLSRGLYRVRVTGEATAMDGIDPNATVVFVLNHRSNMDYVLVTWLAARQTALAYAVGEWARGWPLRVLIRAMGGYFVRRKHLNPLYRKVLARYVQIATQNGVTQAFFPEGRLSRNGALQPPKLGILSYIIADHDAEDARDVVFIPVAVNYERVLEDTVLISAGRDSGRSAQLKWYTVARHALMYLQLRMRGRFTRLGYAAVSFGEPLSLQRFLADGPSDPAAALGEALMERLEAVLPVVPLALVSEALRHGARDVAVVAAHLEARVDDWKGSGHPVHYALREARDTAIGALRMLEGRGALTLVDDKIKLDDEWLPVIEYYAANLPVQKPAET